jgi:outer membrane protein OmpA-like peptidoglycan-associated protein
MNKTPRLIVLFAILLLAANANALDFKKAAKVARKASADLEQIAKKFEKLESDKVKVSEDERGVVLTFSAQLFAVGKADLTDEAKENLQEAAVTLAEYPDADVEIEGHTDSTGSAKLNLELSENRAKNVMSFLIEKGISENRLSAVGYGKDRPIADNGTDEGRATNRRVELVVKVKEPEPEPELVVEEKEEEKEGIRFGVRANAGYASTGLSVQMYGGDAERISGGIAGGIGGIVLIPFKSIYFAPEISLQYRKPVAYFSGWTNDGRAFSDLALAEITIDIPLMFRFRYQEGNLIYFGIGPLLGVVLSSYYDNGGIEVLNENRGKADYGIAMELGFRINRNFSIDIRGLASGAPVGLTEYVGIGGDAGYLIQGLIGVSYLF